MKDLQQKEIRDTICDEDYKDRLKLVNIFMKHNILLNKIYTEIMEWKNNNDKITSLSMTIDSLLKCAKEQPKLG